MFDKDGEFISRRLKSAFVDVCLVHQVAKRLESEVARQINSGSDTIFGMQPESTVITRRMEASTLLKSIYFHACVYIETLLVEVFEIPLNGRRDLHLTKLFRENLKEIIDYSEPIVTKVHCIISYRNGLLAHHSFERYFGNTSTRDGRDIRLFPVPAAAYRNHGSMPKDIYGKYKRLCEAYPPAEGDDLDVYGQSHRLFYTVPYGCGTTINPMRELADAVAHHNGCKSNTAMELVEVLDMFSLSLDAAAKRQEKSD